MVIGTVGPIMVVIVFLVVIAAALVVRLLRGRARARARPPGESARLEPSSTVMQPDDVRPARRDVADRDRTCTGLHDQDTEEPSMADTPNQTSEADRAGAERSRHATDELNIPPAPQQDPATKTSTGKDDAPRAA